MTLYLVWSFGVLARAQLVNVRANDSFSSGQVQLNDVVDGAFPLDDTAGNPGLGVALAVLGHRL